jgi:hypothetical protein
VGVFGVVDGRVKVIEYSVRGGGGGGVTLQELPLEMATEVGLDGTLKLNAGNICTGGGVF